MHVCASFLLDFFQWSILLPCKFYQNIGKKCYDIDIGKGANENGCKNVAK